MSTSEPITIDDLAGLFCRFEEDLRRSLFVKDLTAASASALDAHEVARAYVQTAVRAGAVWGAVYSAELADARLLAADSGVERGPEFASAIPASDVCSTSAEHVAGMLPDALPPGMTSPGESDHGRFWVLESLRYSQQCLGVVVLGFESAEEAPQRPILADAYARLATALHNSRLYEEQALSARLNRLLDDADVRMLASATPEDVCSITRESLEEGLMACTVTITLPEPSTPPTPRVRTEVKAQDGGLEASFRVMERPGTLTLSPAAGRTGFSPAEIEFVSRLASTMALAIESRMLQLERDDLMRAREEWVADLSHDIRTPLASIRGYAELLSTGSDIEEQEVQREASLIARQATVIERLVQDLQTAFRLRFNKLPVSLTSADITPIIEEALEAAVWHAGRGRQSVPFEHPAYPVLALVDKAHFSRIVANLATNAFVHNPPETRVSAVLTCHDKRAYLTVADDGLGMDMQLAQRACRRGERGDSGAPGSGLGMAIVHELTQAMGGQVRIESAEGRGTSVTVTLPIAPESAEECR